MATIHLKVFYLRTREKKLSQQAVAEALGVRQATLSHLERGASTPSAGLLVQLCQFFDVTPTWLLDDERDIPPLDTERWRFRNGLLTVGMWVEAPAKALVRLPGGQVLCPLVPNAAFFDAEAAGIRRNGNGERAIRAAIAALKAERMELQARLRAELEAEQAAHPSQRDGTLPAPRSGRTQA